MMRGRGGGSTRPRPGGMPSPPDINGSARGLGYGGMYNKGGYGGRHGAANQAGADALAQFNAWTDPNIGGEQPGPLQRGWGGFGYGQTSGATGQGSMMATKMNGWLNTFTDPVERAQKMNALGYNNYGNPYDPQAARGTNRFYRSAANNNQAAGASGYTAPGTYLHQSSYGGDVGTEQGWNYGGYIGATQVGDNGAATYSPWDVNARGSQRPRRRTGTTGGALY